MDPAAKRLGKTASPLAFSDEPQPLFRIGIRTSDFLQPLDTKGDAAFPNLFAAGSILRGYDFIHDRTGSGVAILTGAVAGENASALMS